MHLLTNYYSELCASWQSFSTINTSLEEQITSSKLVSMNPLPLSEFDKKAIAEIYRKEKFNLDLINVLYAPKYSLQDSQGKVISRISHWLNEVKNYLLRNYEIDQVVTFVLSIQTDIISKGHFRIIPALLSDSNCKEFSNRGMGRPKKAV